ncbi:MAG: SUMF1/EgtB/PvdO family nonheme iron enzyme, partial [Candidatus Sumerlaeia bacterium]|nr:SUMF1/EgtB/PvdO family nonheme iron enzyme [Candidatus Sumerlaeia bacterium]
MPRFLLFCLSILIFAGFPASMMAQEERTIILPGDVELELVLIPAGSFVMGSPEDEVGRSGNEGPLTNVTLTKDFYMGKYPVTQEQWDALRDINPSLFSGRPDNPVENVSWFEIQGFISALNAHISATDQGPVTLRLPSDAEWEYAARAGTTTRFYFGDSLGCDDQEEDCAAGALPGNRSDYMWWEGNNGNWNDGDPDADYGTKPVGQKLPNAFGLYDMHGNVREWSRDYFASLPGGSVFDPRWPDPPGGVTNDPRRVVRGGGWDSDAGSCRSASRSSVPSSTSRNNLGFRLVGVPPPPPTITIDSPPPNQTVGNETTSVAFAGTASAVDSTVSSVQWRINGGEWQAASGTTSWDFSASPLEVGTNLIEVRATNAEGTHSDLSSPFATRTILRQAEVVFPPPSIVSPSANETVGNDTTSVTFSGTASSPDSTVSAVHWRNNGGAWQAASGTTSWDFSASPLEVGVNLIEVRATNAEGTHSELSSRVVTRLAEEIIITLPGDIPLIMVRIPAGSFVMGSPGDERGRGDDEGPQTNVTLTQDYFMSRYPVTQAQWEAVMGEEWPHLDFPGRPNNPMERVSWDDAQNFITALNTHIISTGQGATATFRLPTEAEWEYAARAGTTTRFHFGDSLSVADACQDDGIRSQYMWYCGNNASSSSDPDHGTKPVGQKLPNAFGLYDMHGNVWEWCQDWYSSSLPGGSVTDPTGPTGFDSSGQIIREDPVLRGGDWDSSAGASRSANRWRAPRSISGGTFYSFGFRLASEPIESVPFPPPIITTPSANQTVSNETTSVDFSGTATASDSTVSSVQWRNNGGAWQTASGTTSWSFTADGLVVGTNLIEVRATDDEGTHSSLAQRTITREAPTPSN